MSQQKYSDLQVVVAEEEPKYPVVDSQKAWTPPARYSAEKIAVQSQAYEVSGPVHQDSEKAQVPAKQRRKVCGLSKFAILMIVVSILVIGGAVGGGVGATLSSKNNVKSASAISTGMSTGTSTATSRGGSRGTSTIANTSLGATSTAPATAATSLSSQSESQSQEQSSTLSATATTQPTSVIISTTTIVGPSGTLLSDCPSSNDTIYVPDSTTQMFRKLCDISLVNVNNDAAAVTVQVSTLDDCITACAGFNVQHASDIASGKTSVCNAACWRSTGGDYGGWCYGYTTQNSTGTFMLGTDNRCNSGALINQ